MREKDSELKILLTLMSTKLSGSGQNGCSSGRKDSCYKSNPVNVKLRMSDHVYQTWLLTKACVVGYYKNSVKYFTQRKNLKINSC